MIRMVAIVVLLIMMMRRVGGPFIDVSTGDRYMQKVGSGGIGPCFNLSTTHTYGSNHSRAVVQVGRHLHGRTVGRAAHLSMCRRATDTCRKSGRAAGRDRTMCRLVGDAYIRKRPV